MAGRIRTIKPELIEDEKAAALSDRAWRLFVSSWVLADDYGRFRAGARYLAAQVWHDTGRVADAEAAREELVAKGRIFVYQVDGDTYAEIPTWAKHQRVDNAGKARVPSKDSAHLRAVSPRTSASLGGLPLEPQNLPLYLRPPTSDLRPPTSDHEHPGSEPDGSGVSAAPSSVEAPTSSDPPTDTRSPADRVFGAYVAGWQKWVGGTKAPKLTSDRRRLIAARLREFGADDLIAAASGVWASEWNRTEPQRRSIELVFSDAAHVEQFRDMATPNPDYDWLAGHWLEARRHRGLPADTKPASDVIATVWAKAIAAGPDPRAIAAHWIDSYLAEPQARAGGVSDSGYPLAWMLSRFAESLTLPPTPAPSQPPAPAPIEVPPLPPELASQLAAKVAEGGNGAIVRRPARGAA